MSKEYDPKEIEGKWQKEWQKTELYKTPDVVVGKENFYFLTEFAYPSGNLHLGHWYAFSVPDILARYLRMNGKNVLYPAGFDAFGLPAENAAIKNKRNPAEWTFANIDYMRKQQRSMGASFDWSREIVTCDPKYYRWTQWQFIEFLKKGLAYQAEREVNWCPKDKTVLANEQVINGHCERCDSVIEKRNMLQWNLKITDYADRLINDLDRLDWPEPIKEAQKNWIGRSEGVEINFEIKNSNKKIKVFTTRPDTIFGATYVVLAPEHELVLKLKPQISNWNEIVRYIEQANNKTEIHRTAEGKEKTGLELRGVEAINPATKKEIPVWIADYVLPHYGTGAIMGVPADDERDKEFAEKFNLLIVENYTAAGFEDYGNKVTKYKLRDWVVSRQRYWGVPIPVIHCKKCGAQPVLESELPVLLPEIEDYLPRDDGKSPLAKVRNWVEVKCPKCGGEAERETDTLDTFVDSSWYYLRYTDPYNDKQLASKEKMNKWMPVDLYSGGSEHTTMHLLYSRFWHKVLFDLGLVGESEPYQRRMNRGLILGPDGQKMSKSRGNVIDPDKEVERLGADTVRMYMAFIGPYNVPGNYPWNLDAAVGIRRFLERIWLVASKDKNDDARHQEVLMNQTIKKVSEDIEAMKFNTAISSLMIWLNAREKKEEGFSKTEFEILLLLLAPFAPHITEELWHSLGRTDSIHTQNWPTYDSKKIERDEITLAVQVDDKVRASLLVLRGQSEEEIKAAALALPEVKKWLNGKAPKKVIIVPRRIISIVT